MFTKVVLVLSVAGVGVAHASTCVNPLDLPYQQEFSSMEAINKTTTDITKNSCALIDDDPLYKDSDISKNWCTHGCQMKIEDGQKAVFMPEMATDEARNWHSNWHTLSGLYGEMTTMQLAQAINNKLNPPLGGDGDNNTAPVGGLGGGIAGGSIGGSSGGSTSGEEESPRPVRPSWTPPDLSIVTEENINKLNDEEYLKLYEFYPGKERLVQFIQQGEIPSECHKTLAVEKRKPVQTTPEVRYSEDYTDCVNKNLRADMQKFYLWNKDKGGENFLYMHHNMRNQVQMMLTAAGQPCIAGWEPIPGPDGKTGNKEKNWEEIWGVSDFGKDDIFTSTEVEEMQRLNLSRDAYLEKKSAEIADKIVAAKAENKSFNEINNILNGGFTERRGLNVLGKLFENEKFLASVSMHEMGKLMEGSIHNRMHGAFNDGKPCEYTVNGVKKTHECNLGSPQGAHVHGTFWKLHGWCDDVIKKWMKAGDRDYNNIGTTETCTDPSCYRVQGTWIGGMPQF